MQIEGKHCYFDYSLYPERKELAEKAVEYIDKRAMPMLYEMLDLPVPEKKLKVFFKDQIECSLCFVWPADEIQIKQGEFKDNDLGALIHECVHRTQYTSDANAVRAREIIFEAVADYYRIVLSEDRKGDHYNDDKLNLVKIFDKEEPWNSVSEFLAYLRRLSGNANLIKELNQALRSNNTKIIDDFFTSRFNGQDWAKLLTEYVINRGKLLTANAETINRYAYFTEMK